MRPKLHHKKAFGEKIGHILKVLNGVRRSVLKNGEPLSLADQLNGQPECSSCNERRLEARQIVVHESKLAQVLNKDLLV